MLNKIKIIGEVLPIEIKEEIEKNFYHHDSTSEEAVNDSDKSQSKHDSEKEIREPWFYFSLSVTNPNRSSTILRCVAQGENAERIKKEIKGGELVQIRGYLRNERDGRQILIKVLEFKKLDADFVIDKEKSANQVRLIGKIITDLQEQIANKRNPEILSFKLAVPREGNKSPLFFCRVHGEKLITEFSEKLKRGDIILLEGFLQTKKIEGAIGEESEKKFSRISSIICYGFTFLDSDSVSVFSPLDNLARIIKKVEEIDFNKPKAKL